MKFHSLLTSPGLKQTIAGLAFGAVCATASALPVFTLDPAGAGLAGGPVTADNIIISDFSTVRFTGPGTFSDSGYLAVQTFQLGGTTVPAPGLNTTYGLYFDFAGTGTVAGGNPATTPTSGEFTSLTYSLYGYNGPPATFGFDAGDNPTVSGIVGPTVLLATGALLPGPNQSSVGSSPQSPSFVSFAGANLSFVPEPGTDLFFVSPDPFYNVAVSSFINSPSQVSPVAGGFQNGFRISQGGGSVNFAAPIPEPETYALMLAGLAAVGFVGRRRKPAR